MTNQGSKLGIYSGGKNERAESKLLAFHEFLFNHFIFIGEIGNYLKFYGYIEIANFDPQTKYFEKILKYVFIL